MTKKQKAPVKLRTIKALKALAKPYDHEHDKVIDACGLKQEDILFLLKRAITADVVGGTHSSKVEAIDNLVDNHPMAVRILVFILMTNIQEIAKAMMPMLSIVATLAEARGEKVDDSTLAMASKLAGAGGDGDLGAMIRGLIDSMKKDK